MEPITRRRGQQRQSTNIAAKRRMEPRPAYLEHQWSDETGGQSSSGPTGTMKPAGTRSERELRPDKLTGGRQSDQGPAWAWDCSRRERTYRERHHEHKRERSWENSGIG